MARLALALLPGLALFALASPAGAQEREPYQLERVRIGASLTYSSFEQQVKSEIGGTSVEPLVVDRAFGLHLTATANLWRFIRLGVFFQIDAGNRSMGRFEGLMAGEPEVTQLIEGRYWEVWLGPLLRLQWRFLAAEIGYGLVGARRDRARVDLPDGAGGTSDPFRTSPRVAWHFALAAYAPVHPEIDIVIRVQYRVRYYDRRSSSSLENGVVHGTQNLTPTIGIAWHR
ncbi:MAG: hypothetical protein JJ863_02095 [Deltaproteobacteria bacterium]|nr:hypothetical protein [Deltaproteobacteria bacterium]